MWYKYDILISIIREDSMELMKKYKRCVSVLVSAILCLGLAACGDASVQGDTDSKTESKSGSAAKETVLTKDEWNGYLKEVEITTENWEDYFSVEDYHHVEKDDLDEISYDADQKILVCQENVIPADRSSENALVFEFSYTSSTTGAEVYDKATGEDVSGLTEELMLEADPSEKTTTIHSCDISSIPDDNSESVDEVLYETRVQYGSSIAGDTSKKAIYTYDISNLTLNRVKGSVKVANIPDDKWNTDEEHGKYIVVNAENDSNSNYYMFENGAVFKSDSFENIDWDSINKGGDEGLASWGSAIEEI